MRVLVLTQVAVYPADAGPKIKTLAVIRHLATRHEVFYCTFVRNEQEKQGALQLGSLCHRISTVPLQRSRAGDLRYLLESLATGDSFLLRRDDRSAMHTMVQQLLQEEKIDVMHVDQLNMMRFVPDDWPGRVILDEHNAVWQVVERLRTGSHNPLTRLLLRREVAKMRKLEGEACRRATAVLAVSEQDRQSLYAVAGAEVQIEVVPITVDVAKLSAIWSQRDPQSNRLLTVGTLFWPPNSEGISWWLRTGYEQLQALCPDVQYDLVGARPPHELQRLAAEYRGVNLHGYVADVQPFWSSATALIVPLLSGGGVRVKILEAMAMGVPVISTTIGCEGLAVQDGEHLLIADTPEGLAQACAKILQDPLLASRLAQNAHQRVLEQYDAQTALKSLDRIYTLSAHKDVVAIAQNSQHHLH